MTTPQGPTEDAAYTERLRRLSGARWKRAIDVQAPYRWNLRRVLPYQRTLDVGCGLGRNLANLPEGSMGVDHNSTSIEHCRRAGLAAMTVDDFLAADRADIGVFDGLLAAHLIEHLAPKHAASVLATYLDYLAPRATVVLICPQERGFASDATHTVFTDNSALHAVAQSLKLEVVKQYSFPFPRFAGRLFTYNEFVTVART